eukprot:m.47274 g.47274  ORF g.47274 m.47274 type:complete len:66 (+) comp12311_c0_seq2:210-407(+)
MNKQDQQRLCVCFRKKSRQTLGLCKRETGQSHENRACVPYHQGRSQHVMDAIQLFTSTTTEQQDS